jgi:hypothetical protein
MVRVQGLGAKAGYRGGVGEVLLHGGHHFFGTLGGRIAV